MGKIMVPGFVNRQIESDEKILTSIMAKAKGSIATQVSYIATNKRLFRFRNESDCQTLDYAGISINYVPRSIVRSIVVTVVGLLTIAIGFVGFMSITWESSPNVTNVFQWTHWWEPWLIWGLGAYEIIGSWTWLRMGYYQISHKDITKDNPRKWRIEKRIFRAQKTDYFARIISKKAEKVEV